MLYMWVVKWRHPQRFVYICAYFSGLRCVFVCVGWGVCVDVRDTYL